MTYVTAILLCLGAVAVGAMLGGYVRKDWLLNSTAIVPSLLCLGWALYTGEHNIVVPVTAVLMVLGVYAGDWTVQRDWSEPEPPRSKSPAEKPYDSG